jgi:hypothetical protein
MPEDELTEVGCYEDNAGQPDFELLLSTKLIDIRDCVNIAFEKNYQYVGLQAGGKCWGSSKLIGKYGKTEKCNYKCPNG